MELANTTIAGNEAPNGGGVYVEPAGTLEARNSIIADNIHPTTADPNDCEGTLNSLVHNLIETTTGCTILGDTTGNITGEDPLLDVLADNGGETMTMALLEGSPAINAGDPLGCVDPGGVPLDKDQRGILRPSYLNPDCDMGAVEALPELSIAMLQWAALMCVAALVRGRQLRL